MPHPPPPPPPPPQVCFSAEIVINPAHRFKVKEEEPRPFKAQEVPPATYEPIYERMKQQEQHRKVCFWIVLVE